MYRKIKNSMWTLVLATITFSFSLTACSLDDDEQKDKVEIIKLYVSSETGNYYPLFFEGKATEGMQIKEEGWNRWYCVNFATITGFTFNKGNEYVLLVKKTTLANPPQDDSNVRYELIKILSQYSVIDQN